MGQLPREVQEILDEVVSTLRKAFGTELVSFVLYGSAAEGRLRATSDVNSIVVLRSFDRARADEVLAAFRTARTAIRLKTMFLLESELAEALDAFAVKFADVLARRLVLFGRDPFADASISRTAEIARLRQLLLNLQLRMRESYVSHAIHEEQLALQIADLAGPIRVCAATLLELEGEGKLPPKESLETYCRRSPEMRQKWESLLPLLSQAREERSLPPGAAAPAFFGLMELAASLKASLDQLR